MKHKRTFLLFALLLLVAFVTNGGTRNFSTTLSPISSAQAQTEGSAPADPNANAQPEHGVTAEQGRAILSLLNDLKSLTLDDSLFSDPLFTNLVDFSTELTPEPKGRQDPFAPINVSAAPTIQGKTDIKKTGTNTP